MTASLKAGAYGFSIQCKIDFSFALQQQQQPTLALISSWADKVLKSSQHGVCDAAKLDFLTIWETRSKHRGSRITSVSLHVLSRIGLLRFDCSDQAPGRFPLSS